MITPTPLFYCATVLLRDDAAAEGRVKHEKYGRYMTAIACVAGALSK
jgi:hypothetical protein